MNRELGVVVAGVATDRLAVDQLTEAIEENRLARQHRYVRNRGLESQFGERLRRVRKDVDAHAERTHSRRRLVNLAGDLRTMKEKRERQSSDAGSDNDDVQRSSASARDLRI